MNRLLKRQIVDYVTGEQVITKEFMDLMQSISDTYDFFEKKVAENTVPPPVTVKEPVRLTYSSLYQIPKLTT